jgi:hypothetical protein
MASVEEAPKRRPIAFGSMEGLHSGLDVAAQKDQDGQGKSQKSLHSLPLVRTQMASCRLIRYKEKEIPSAFWYSLLCLPFPIRLTHRL